ncbi:hypothetical protein ACTXG6_34050 [Pseudonocardia sp. Cha107L01]|uniref:hypothetical protein n=1 Tax=Pseudonocardia sp. Cha107L01 TaxID=3457576 RepID=UPI00403E5EBB
MIPCPDGAVGLVVDEVAGRPPPLVVGVGRYLETMANRAMPDGAPPQSLARDTRRRDAAEC